MRKEKLLCLCLSANMFIGLSAYANDFSYTGDGSIKNVSQQAYPTITLNLKNASVKILFEKIHQQTGYDFMYSSDIIGQFPKITKSVKNISLDQLLDDIFSGSNYSYTIKGKMVTLRKRELKSHSAQTVKGKVTDINKEPIIGATIIVKGTPNGTVTDINGRYSINVKPSQTLQVSYIGMEPKEIKYNGSSVLNITLAENKNTQLNDVVVTGIFKKAKESYTGAVSTISSEDLKIYKGQNLLQTIKNVDASINFTVDNLAGSNPNTLPDINIRGNSSLPTSVQEFNEDIKNSVNTPLIVMDGFEISLTKLMDYNDDEIESINILKDASATAIYGSRGANGVIVVVSKKPEIGRLKVNAEMGFTAEIADLSSYHLLNAADKLQLEYNAGLYENSTTPSVQDDYSKIYNERLKAVLSGVDTDWLKKPVQNGLGQRYNLRVEGGTKEFRWATAMSYNNVVGAMKGSSRNTFNGSVTLMCNLKNVIFRNYTSIGYNDAEESKYGSYSKYAQQQPYNAPYDSEGNLVRHFKSFYGDSYIQNPLYDASLNSFDKTGYQSVVNNFSIDWNILRELTLRGQLGISTTQNTSDSYLSAKDSYFTDNAEFSTDEGFLRRGSYNYGTGRSTNYEGNITLSYNKNIKDLHQIYVGTNYTIADSHRNLYGFTAEGFANEDKNDIINARQYTKDSKPNGYDNVSRRLSLTVNANYTYNNRYFLDLSYRVDGSSEFGSDKKYAPFWSSGIGWNLHNEAFMKNKTPINTLRLKVSYGQTGSQQNSSSGASTVYRYLTNNKYMSWTGAVLEGLGNTNLTWQKTDQFNLGTEFGLFENRIKGSFDVYSKKTSNLLSYMDLPLSMGFSRYLSNVGEVKNTGWEASLSTYVIRDKKHKINWIVGGQLMYNKNRITKLSDAIKTQNEEYMKQGTDVSNLFFEGYPQNAIYAVKSLGIDPSTGSEVFIDREGNKTTTWDAKDKVFQGSRDPKYRGNLSSTLIWKKFTFNMSWGYYWGGKVYNSTLLDKVEVTYNKLMYSNVDERVLTQRWYKPGDLVFFKKLSYTSTRASSRFVMKDDVLNLQSASLQYRWDTPGLKKAIGASSIIFAMNMSNIFHFSTIKMERGTNYPYARTVQGSVKLSF